MRAFKVKFLTKYKIQEERIVITDDYVGVIMALKPLLERITDPLAQLLSIELVDTDPIIDK